MAMLLAMQEPATAPEVRWLPPDLLYRLYLADPRAPHSGSHIQFPIREEDDPKIENVLGNQWSLVRGGRPGEEWEIQLELAAFGRFDASHALDLEGTDYRFGGLVAQQWDDVTAKVHLWHVTSHLGDEYHERTNVERISFARNEIAVGVSWDVDPKWRVYAEAGWGYHIGNPNEPWRVQGGVEFVEPLEGCERTDLFVAGNLTSHQETDWDPQANVAAGVQFGSERGAGLRVGAEYFRGPTPQTQFFQENGHYWSLGFWFLF